MNKVSISSESGPVAPPPVTEDLTPEAMFRSAQARQIEASRRAITTLGDFFKKYPCTPYHIEGKLGSFTFEEWKRNGKQVITKTRLRNEDIERGFILISFITKVLDCLDEEMLKYLGGQNAVTLRLSKRIKKQKKDVYFSLEDLCKIISEIVVELANENLTQ